MSDNEILNIYFRIIDDPSVNDKIRMYKKLNLTMYNFVHK